jgi:hypothetical protein
VSVQQNHTGNLIKVAYFFAGIWYIFRVALTAVNVNQILGQFTGLKLGHLDVKKLVFLCLSRKSLLKPVTFTVNVQYVCIMG